MTVLRVQTPKSVHKASTNSSGKEISGFWEAKFKHCLVSLLIMSLIIEDFSASLQPTLREKGGREVKAQHIARQMPCLAFLLFLLGLFFLLLLNRQRHHHWYLLLFSYILELSASPLMKTMKLPISRPSKRSPPPPWLCPGLLEDMICSSPIY